MAFSEPLELSPPFVSQVWWLLYLRLVPLWFGTFFLFTLRRDLLLRLYQPLLRQAFEGLQDIRIQGLQAVLFPAFKMHDPRRLPPNIELEPLSLQLLPKCLSIGAPAQCRLNQCCNVTRLIFGTFCPLAGRFWCFAFRAFFNGSALLEFGHGLENVPLKLQLNFPKTALGQTQAFRLSGRVRADNQVVVERVLLVLMQIAEDQVVRTSLCDVALGYFP